MGVVNMGTIRGMDVVLDDNAINFTSFNVDLSDNSLDDIFLEHH